MKTAVILQVISQTQSIAKFLAYSSRDPPRSLGPVKRIHFTEQHSIVLLGEMLYSFDPFVVFCSAVVGAAQCYTALFNGDQKCWWIIKIAHA